jgi:hypothetical protein
LSGADADEGNGDGDGKGDNYPRDISQIDFSHKEPPGVPERLCSVHLDSSISGEY